MLEYYPAALSAFEDWTDRFTWDFVLEFPTPEALVKAGRRRWEKFLHTHRLWRAETVEKRLKLFAEAEQFKASAPIVRAKSQLAMSLSKLLRTLGQQLDLYRQQIEALFTEHPDHDLFGSLPGAKQTLAPRLLAAVGKDPDRYGSHAVLQCIAGTAPVSYQSGKINKVHVLLDASQLEIKRDATIYLCSSELTRGRFQKAIERLEQVVALAEKSGEKIWEIRAKMFLSYIYGSAIKDYRRFLKLNDEILKFAVWENRGPMTQSALTLRAMVLAAMRSFPEALNVSEEIRDIVKGDPNKKLIRDYFAVMGRIELERNDPAKAIKYTEDSLALFPSGGFTIAAWIYDTLGQAYFRMGDTEKARAAYEEISALTSSRFGFGDIYTRSFYWLGKIHEKRGDAAKARENYRRFLDLWKDADPGLPEVEDARKRLVALNGG